MIFFINTANSDKIVIALSEGEEVLAKKTFMARFRHAELLLLRIEEVLERQKKNLKDLKGIIVVQGPGSFTSLRVGLVTANTLGFALKIPVVGIMAKERIEVGLKKLKKAKTEALVLPFYGRPPQITKPQEKK